MNRKYKLLLIFVTAVYLFINLPVLKDSPLPWPDEAVYADIAIHWQDSGLVTTNLWQGMIPGIESIAAWNPPGYFLLTAATFQLLSRNMLSQRLISLAAGLICTLLLIDISRRLSKPVKHRRLILLAGLLLFDYQYMVATRLARAEIVILSLGIFSWWLIMIWRKSKIQFSHLKSFFLGIIPGIAGLLHPLGLSMGAIGILLTSVEVFKKKPLTIKIGAYITGLILPMLIWLFSIRGYWGIVWQQVQLASNRKVLEESWVMLSFLLPITRLAVVFCLLGLALLFILKSAYLKNNLVGWYISALAFCFSLLILWGRMMWYTVYALPFLYVAFVYWLNLTSKKNRYPLYLAYCLLAAQAYMTWTNIYRSPIPTRSYGEFCRQILQKIPDKTTVFLSATPDPYYCFLEDSRQNRLLEFPVLSMPEFRYESILNEVDYIIYQKSYDQILFPDFLSNYIDRNLIESTPVYGLAPQHQALVIRLRQPNTRIITETLPKSVE